MAFSGTQTSGAGVSGRPGLDTTLLVILMLVIVVAAVVVVVATALFIGPALSVTKKNFAPYSTPVSQNSNSPSSLTVVDTNGGVTVSPWSQTYLMINGTITARGVGANPDTITFIESNSSNKIIFQAIFPTGASFFFSTGYTVDINVYTPASAHFNAVQVTTVNGNVQISSISAASETFTVTNGNLSVSSITAPSLTLTDTNGNINLTCSSCASVTATTTSGSVTANLGSLSPTGSYTLTSTNGNINLTVPASGSFKITTNTTNGSVSSSGLAAQLTNHVTSTFGLGTAVVTATTTNGSITVTGV